MENQTTDWMKNPLTSLEIRYYTDDENIREYKYEGQV